MRHFPLRLRLWVLVLIALGVWAVALVASDRHPLSVSDLATALILLLILTVIERWDVSISLSATSLRVSVGTSVGLAAAMTLGPAIACLIVFAGHLLDSLLARRDPIKSITNICTYVAATGLSGTFYVATANLDDSPVSSLLNIGSSLGASAIHVTTSTLLMAWIVAPIIGMPLGAFLQSATRLLTIEAIAMPAVAGLLDLAARENPIAVLLLSFPLIGPQLAFRTLIRAQESVRSTLETLSDTIEQRDPYTAYHSERVAALVRRILQEMPDVPFDLTETIAAAARVHDIGKIGTRDVILFKNGPLTTEERKDIQRHTIIGSDILSSSEEYRLTALIVRHHHEFWNGHGYPDQIAGQEIPLGSRIIAVADAYDTMTTDRPYRTAMSQSAAIDEIRRNSGTQFDPAVVRAFLSAFGVSDSGEATQGASQLSRQGT